MSIRPSILSIASIALPLMTPAARAEAAALLAQLRTANAAQDDGHEFAADCAKSWEDDMQGVRSAIATALHDGSTEALGHLRKMLPFLLREANRKPALGAELARAMAAAVADPSVLERTGNASDQSQTANAVTVDSEPTVTSALKQWRSREVFETDLGSAELRGFSRELLNRSIFSARVTNAEFLSEVATAVDDILAGKTNMAQGRWVLQRKLKQLGYDPMLGFPGDMANIPPAEAGSLQDLSSTQRLDLIIETNVRMASNYAQHLAGNTPYALRAYPAWELVRRFVRDVPRGSPESKSIGWPQRWADAAEAVNDEGVLERVRAVPDMVARKDSPIWQALGDGAGDYTDTLGNPYPPFAFRSGMAWQPVRRDRCVSLGLITGDESPRRTDAQLSPGEREVRAAFEKLSPDLRAELERELNTGTDRAFLDRTQAQHEATQRAVRDERISRATQVQAVHRARMKAMTEGIE
jgi:hypothetical protein